MITERFSLANRGHLNLFMSALILFGSVCDVCGQGTRRTSRRWARCKNPECGTRVRRRSDAEVEAIFAAAAAAEPVTREAEEA